MMDGGLPIFSPRTRKETQSFAEIPPRFSAYISASLGERSIEFFHGSNSTCFTLNAHFSEYLILDS